MLTFATLSRARARLIDMISVFEGMAFNAGLPSNFQNNTTDAWLETPCWNCRGQQMAVIARTEHDSILWLRCVSCQAPMLRYDQRFLPQPLGEPAGLAEDDARMWNEIRSCLSVGAYTAAVMLSRKLLLHMAVSAGLPEKNEKG